MSAPKTSICICEDYTRTPGPRNPDEGRFSGENFLDTILKPAWEYSVLKKSRLYIDLDDTEGYATSFLEAAFGGLARRYGVAAVKSGIDFKSDEEPYLIDEISLYIDEALNK